MTAARAPGLRSLMQKTGRVDRRLVVFDAWRGRHADSPRAISEELLRREAPFDQVWVRSSGGADVAGARNVRPGSTAHLRALGTAGYLVTNNSMPGYYRKRPGTTYVQTWHGTPLKRIALDIENPRFEDAQRYLGDLRRDVAGWDYLVSPNAFSTPVFRRAFGYDGRVLETGYPRNDVLLSPDRDAVRARVRAELEIADGTTAVLYAPTWRDSREFTVHRAIEGIAAELGDPFRVLVRTHSLVTQAALDSESRLTDVSGRDDVADLLLAADVLVTDYSSIMFDFAVTGKPMIFFVYDLEEYRDEMRGFYFDFESEAPGPLLTDPGDVAAALGDLAGLRARSAGAYARFSNRFCRLEDGKASQRVVAEVFGL